MDMIFFFSSRRRHTRFDCDWSSDVCSSDLTASSGLNGRRERFFQEIQPRISQMGTVSVEKNIRDRKSTRLNSSHSQISYAVFCLKKKKNKHIDYRLERLTTHSSLHHCSAYG